MSDYHYIARDCGLHEGHEPGHKTTKEWMAWRDSVSRDWIARELDDGVEAFEALLAKYAAFADFCRERDAA